MRIWIIKVGEPLPWLPLEPGGRLWRAGQLATLLSNRGHEVIYFASAFDHYRKETRRNLVKNENTNVFNDFDTVLLKSRGYKKNMSIARWFDHRDLAADFIVRAAQYDVPDLVIACWPTIELAFAASIYAKKHGVPFVVDVRDCWPDIIYQTLPKPLCYLPKYLLPYEEMVKVTLGGASALTAVSEGILTWAQKRGRRPGQALAHDFHFYQTQSATILGSHYSKFWLNKGVSIECDAKIRFVWAGSLEPTLDLKTVLDAIDNLPDHVMRSFEFVFCGVGSLQGYIERRVRRMANVVFCGYVGEMELKYLLSISQIGFMSYPDRFDFNASIPNKCVDFCLSGMRILTNLNGEIDKLVPESELLKYQSGNVLSLERCFLTIYQNFDFYKTYSKNTREVFNKNFDTQVIMDDVCRKLENIVVKKII